MKILHLDNFITQQNLHQDGLCLPTHHLVDLRLWDSGQPLATSLPLTTLAPVSLCSGQATCLGRPRVFWQYPAYVRPTVPTHRPHQLSAAQPAATFPLTTQKRNISSDEGFYSNTNWFLLQFTILIHIQLNHSFFPASTIAIDDILSWTLTKWFYFFVITFIVL